MPTNNFVPVAAAAGSNVTTDASWNGSSFQVTGVQKGIVPSAGMNKAWRQGTMGASALGQIIVDHGLVDAVDDGNVPGLKANLRMSIAAMLAGAAFAADQSSTANLLTVILDPVPPALSTYRGLYVRVANTNTGPVTLTLNGLGNKSVVKRTGQPLVAGDLIAGQFIHLIYDLVLQQWTAAGFLGSDVAAAPTSASTGTFTLPSQQNIPNNATTQITITGSNTPWGTFANNGVTITKSGNYAINLLMNGTVYPSSSTATSHATICFIYINGQQVSQQTAINYTGIAQSIALSNTFISYLVPGTTINWWAYMGNSGTSDVCVINSASATVTKLA